MKSPKVDPGTLNRLGSEFRIQHQGQSLGGRLPTTWPASPANTLRSFRSWEVNPFSLRTDSLVHAESGYMIIHGIAWDRQACKSSISRMAVHQNSYAKNIETAGGSELSWEWGKSHPRGRKGTHTYTHARTHARARKPRISPWWELPSFSRAPFASKAFIHPSPSLPFSLSLSLSLSLNFFIGRRGQKGSTVARDIPANQLPSRGPETQEGGEIMFS